MTGLLILPKMIIRMISSPAMATQLTQSHGALPAEEMASNFQTWTKPWMDAERLSNGCIEIYFSIGRSQQWNPILSCLPSSAKRTTSSTFASFWIMPIILSTIISARRDSVLPHRRSRPTFLKAVELLLTSKRTSKRSRLHLAPEVLVKQLITSEILKFPLSKPFFF